MLRYFISIALLLIVGQQLLGQTKNEIIQQRIEFIAQDLEEEDISLEDVFDVLNAYYDGHLNLNTASRNDLEELLLLNDFQINALLEKREKDGQFKSLFELKDLPYWDLETLDNIIPFVMVATSSGKKKTGFKQYLKEGKFEGYARYIRNIEPKAGYEKVSDSLKSESNKYYWGDPSKVYSRLRFTHKNDFSIGVTMEKDPGEQLFGKTQPYGFDFYSAHAYYAGGKHIRKAVIGDYQAQFGQGLALWTGYSFSKTVDGSTLKRNAQGLKPYNSTDESRFMRGAGVEIGLNDFSLTAFVSYKRLDGSIVDLDTLENDEDRMLASINESGYHRTTSELARKNAIRELIYGVNLKYEIRRLHIGVTAVQQSYDAFYQRADRLENKYQFQGKNLLNVSANYSYIYRNFSLYGEAAVGMDNKAIAALQGASLAVGRKVTLSAIYRYYPKDYHTFYARGFGDGSNTINESGFYLGGLFKISKAWIFNAYVDFFKSPWLRFNVNSPSNGHELLGQLKFRPSPRFEVYLRAREKQKMINVSAGNYEGNFAPVETYKQGKYQLGLTAELGGGFRWRSRVNYVTDRRESKGFRGGFALSQDLIYRSSKVPIEATVRYAIFNTDGYDTRIYDYEYNMANVFSIPTYSDKGSRAYAMLKYSFLKGKIDVWLRYAIFIYDDKEVISSGNEAIQGNIKSEIGTQIRVKL